MLKFLIFILFIPVLCHPQNIITHTSISKMESDSYTAYEPGFEIYKIRISPGYRDHSYKIKIIQTDSTGKDTILDEPEINVKLNIHRKNIKLENSNKIMWDYATDINSNDLFKDEYIEVVDCSNSRYLNCFIRLDKTLKYKIQVYHRESSKFEFLIGY